MVKPYGTYRMTQSLNHPCTLRFGVFFTFLGHSFGESNLRANQLPVLRAVGEPLLDNLAMQQRGGGGVNIWALEYHTLILFS